MRRFFLILLIISSFYTITHAQDSITSDNVENLTQLQVYNFEQRFLDDVAFSPLSDELSIVIGDFDLPFELVVIDMVSLTEDAQIEFERPNISVTYHPINDQIFLGSYGGFIPIIQPNGFETIDVLEVDTSYLNQINFSPDGDLIAISIGCGGCGSIPITNNLVVVDGETFEELYSYPAGVDGHGIAFTMDFSDDGQFIIYGTTNDDVHIIEVETGERVDVVQGIYQPGIEFHVETQTLTFIDGAGILVWDVTPLYRGEKVTDFRLVVTHDAGSEDTIEHFDLSSDGSMLVVGRFDGSISFWDVETATELASFQAHNRVTNVEFSPDNTLLATTGVDGDLIIWHVPNTVEE